MWSEHTAPPRRPVLRCLRTRSDTLAACRRHRCASATNEKLQLSSLVGAFQQVRERLVQMAT